MRHLLATAALLAAAQSSANSWVTTLSSENGGTQTRVSWVIEDFSFVWSGPTTSLTALSFGGSATANPLGTLPFDTLPSPATFAVSTGLSYSNLTSPATAAIDSLDFVTFDFNGETFGQLRFVTTAGLPVDNLDNLTVIGTTTGSVVLDVAFSSFNEGTWANGPQTLQIGTPVPEPSTYGLILGGLALAGVAVRRRAGKNSK